MNILTLGDSISFGYELNDVCKEPASGFGNYSTDADGNRFELYPSESAFPNIIASRLGADLTNLSLIGGSNDRIFRLAPVEILKNQYDLVICSWSSIDRLDLSYNNEDIAVTVACADHVSERFPWFKNYVADHYDYNKMLELFQVELITLQAWLKSIDQPYIFVTGPYFPIPKLSPFIDYIDKTKFPTWGTSLCDWCDHLPKGPEGHMLEEGHQLIADRLLVTIAEQYPNLVTGRL